MEVGVSESNYTPHVGQPYAVTPHTDAVWDDKSRNILTHSQNLERQRDEAVAERDAERVARKALTKALMICIRYADSSADTEQAYAALALAAKLP